jgi:hypothetical protein
MPKPEIRVEGLGQLRRALRQIDNPDALGQLRDGLKAAAEIVAADARNHMPSRTGRAKSSVRAVASGNQALVIGGKATVPYYGWLDFGSRTPVHGNPRSVGPWRGSGQGPPAGRFIYPAIERNERRIVHAVGEAVEDTIRKAGF